MGASVLDAIMPEAIVLGAFLRLTFLLDTVLLCSGTFPGRVVHPERFVRGHCYVCTSTTPPRRPDVEADDTSFGDRRTDVVGGPDPIPGLLYL